MALRAIVQRTEGSNPSPASYSHFKAFEIFEFCFVSVEKRRGDYSAGLTFSDPQNIHQAFQPSDVLCHVPPWEFPFAGHSGFWHEIYSGLFSFVNIT
jgi:hypothetical protein